MTVSTGQRPFGMVSPVLTMRSLPPLARPRVVTYACRAAIVALITTAIMPGGAGASATRKSPPKPSTSQDRKLQALQQQREQVRSAKAKKATEVDALTATDTQVKQALSDLDANISGQTSMLEDAQRATAAAVAEETDAKTRETNAATELSTLHTTIKSQAVAAYVSSPPDETFTVLSASSATEASSRNTLVELQARRNLDVVERYRSVQQDLSIAKSAAVDAHQRADKHRVEVSDRLDKLQAAQKEQEQFAGKVEARIESSLSEAASLAEVDGALAGQITQTQASIAAELTAQRAASQRRAAAVGVRVSSSSSTSGPNRPAPNFANAGGNGIVSVGGIRVDNSIAGNLQALLSAAAAAGITFGGGGFRDPAQQIALRQAHCGSSNYSVYDAPATSCSPPTARPGQSMHERGLAVDFTVGGATLTRGSAGFAWMQAHAGQYGFYNLPSEPWHWSVNGN